MTEDLFPRLGAISRPEEKSSKGWLDTPAPEQTARFSGIDSSGWELKTVLRYKLHHVLSFSPEQLFDLAADVEQYPDYLPWWIAARVVKREGSVYYTDQIVAFGPIRRRFTTKTRLSRPERIDVTSIDESVRRFDLSWAFVSLPEGGCRVSLSVNLELRPYLLESLFRQALASRISRILAAFEMRARQLYGAVPRTASAAESACIDGVHRKRPPR